MVDFQSYFYTILVGNFKISDISVTRVAVFEILLYDWVIRHNF